MTSKKKIGVLGGIGPEATGDFYLKLIRRFQEERMIKRNEDYPQIIINSIPAPELVHERLSKEDLKTYIQGLKELEQMNVSFIVMVCNTIHLFHKKISKEVKIPILNLRKEVAKVLTERKVNMITVLGTKETMKKGLFTFNEIKEKKITEKEVEELKNAILKFNSGHEISNIDNKNRTIPRPKVGVFNDAVFGIADKYIKKGSVIISGCTELSLMFPKSERIINTTDILVEATLQRFK